MAFIDKIELTFAVPNFKASTAEYPVRRMAGGALCLPCERTKIEQTSGESAILDLLHRTEKGDDLLVPMHGCSKSPSPQRLHPSSPHSFFCL
jgi:hypothetical protein